MDVNALTPEGSAVTLVRKATSVGSKDSADLSAAARISGMLSGFRFSPASSLSAPGLAGGKPRRFRSNILIIALLSWMQLSRTASRETGRTQITGPTGGIGSAGVVGAAILAVTFEPRARIVPASKGSIRA